MSRPAVLSADSSVIGDLRVIAHTAKWGMLAPGYAAGLPSEFAGHRSAVVLMVSANHVDAIAGTRRAQVGTGRLEGTTRSVIRSTVVMKTSVPQGLCWNISALTADRERSASVPPGEA